LLATETKVTRKQLSDMFIGAKAVLSKTYAQFENLLYAFVGKCVWLLENCTE